MIPRFVACAIAVVIAVTSLPAARGQTDSADAPPSDFRNGQSLPFGSVVLAPYTIQDDGAARIEAVVMLDASALDGAARVLFAFNTHSPHVHVAFDSLLGAGDEPVALDRDERPDGEQRVMATPAALAEPGGPFLMVGRAWADAPGQFHVGVLVLAFDDAWATWTSNEQPVELYGFSLLANHAPGGAPFVGQGNEATAQFLMVAFAAAAALCVAAPMLLRRFASAHANS